MKNTLVILCVSAVILLGSVIRLQNLPLLKDAATGEYVSIDPDGLYFLRLAETILETGKLPEFDVLRQPDDHPFLKEILPYAIVLMYKFVHLFDKGVSIQFVGVISPVIFFALGLLAFFFLVSFLTHSKTCAFLSTLLLSIIPVYLYRIMAGVPDHEGIGMFVFFLTLLSYAWALKFLGKEETNPSPWPKIGLGVPLGFLSSITIASWGGIANFVFMIVPVSFGLFWIIKKRDLGSLLFLGTWFLSSIAFTSLYGFPFQEILGRVVPRFAIGSHFMESLLHPFGADRLSETVLENQQPSLSDWIAETGKIFLGLMLGGLVMMGLNIPKIKTRPEILVLLSWALFSLIAARGAMRAFFILAPFACFAAGYFLSKFKGGRLKILLIALALFQSTLFAKTSWQQARSLGPSESDKQWHQAMSWVRNNTPKRSIFANWWDYGYSIQYLGQRPTIADGGRFQGIFRDHLIGRYLLTTPKPETALSFMKTNRVSYLLIDSEDIEKYYAFSKIGSDASGNDRFSHLTPFPYDPHAIKTPVRYVYSEKKLIDFKTGIEGCLYILPIITSKEGEGIKIDRFGAALYLPPKVFQSLFAQLYLMEDPFHHYETLKLVHAQPHPLTDRIALFNNAIIGPIKIWKTKYPDSIIAREEFLRTSGRWAELDHLQFAKNQNHRPTN